jgi:hypothetical protein
MSIDPGQASGWAVGRFPAEAKAGVPAVELLDSGIEKDLQEDFHARNLVIIALGYKPRVLIIEDFIIHADRKDINLRQRNILSPVRITAKFEYGMKYNHSIYPIPNLVIVKQMAGDAKKMWPNERLRDHNVYRPGKADHERDAIRHLMFYATKFANDPKTRKAIMV